MMTLGVVLLLFSTCPGIGTVLAIASGTGPAGWELAVAMGLYLAPGVGFVVCSVKLKRYRPWAAIVGLVLAGMGVLVSLLMVLGFFVLAVTAAEGVQSWGLLLLLIPVLFIAAFTQLIVHLSKSFKAIRIHEMEGPQGYGFVPIMPAPSYPPPPQPPSAQPPTAGHDR